MKKYIRVIIIIFFGVSIFAVPIIINETYKINSGYVTLWGAKDLLAYFGTAISALGTVYIGFIALKQNNRANEINDRLLKLQEINSTPFLHVDSSGSKIHSFRERDIDILIGLRNESNSVINILEVSSLTIDPTSKHEFKVPFCKGWSTHFSVLPHQTKEINFTKEARSNERVLFDKSYLSFNSQFSLLICAVDFKLQFVNSTDIYIQRVVFYLHIIHLSDGESKYKLIINNIENGIERYAGD